MTEPDTAPETALPPEKAAGSFWRPAPGSWLPAGLRSWADYTAGSSVPIWVILAVVFVTSWIVVAALIPVSLFLLAGVAAVAWFLMHRTRFGHHVYAVGGDAESARLSGVRPARVLIAVHVLSGLCAATSGVFLVSRLGAGAPWV